MLGDLPKDSPPVDWDVMNMQTPPVSNPWIPPGDPPDGEPNNLGFVIVSGPAFEIQGSRVTGVAPVSSTVIPRNRTVRATWVDVLWDGATLSYESSVRTMHERVSNPHILHLGAGNGWLMLVSRGRADSPEPLDQGQPSGFASDIIGFWAPDDDPTFAGAEVRGPHWLIDDCHCSPELAGWRVWLSVPTGTVVDVGGTKYLYLYCVAETASFGVTDSTGNYPRDIKAAGFKPGVYAFRVSLSTLQAWMSGDAVSGPDRALPVPLPLQGLPAAAALLPFPERLYREERWTQVDPGQFIAPLVPIGRMKVYTAAEWTGGRLTFEESVAGLKFVDPCALFSEGELVVFLAVAYDPDGAKPNHYWGIWRTVAVNPNWPGLRFGVDFVLYDRALTSASRDQAMSPHTIHDDSDGTPERIYNLDPTVFLRSGRAKWSVLAASVTRSGIAGGAEIVTGFDEDVTRPWTEP